MPDFFFAYTDIHNCGTEKTLFFCGQFSPWLTPAPPKTTAAAVREIEKRENKLGKRTLLPNRFFFLSFWIWPYFFPAPPQGAKSVAAGGERNAFLRKIRGENSPRFFSFVSVWEVQLSALVRTPKPQRQFSLTKFYYSFGERKCDGITGFYTRLSSLASPA